MIRPKYKDAFWELVRDCLVVFHKYPGARALAQCKALREKIEKSPKGLSGNTIYHEEPFNVACDLAGEGLNLEDHWTEYDRLLAEHGWQPHA